MLELSNGEFKITNKTAEEYGRKEDSMHEEMKNFVRDLKTIKRTKWKI